MEIEEYIKIYREYPAPKAKYFWVRDFRNMIVHTRGEHSAELIGKRRPNEEERTMEYRLANDRAITRASFMDAITNLQRILSHSQVEIRYPEKLKSYLQDNNFDDTDLLSYFQRRIIKPMAEMANGLLVWWPIPGNENEVLKIVPIVVSPERIIHYDSEVLTFLSDEKSLVTFNKREVLEGEVHYVILKDSLWKRVQIGKKTDNKFEYIEHSVNATGDIYALKLGGDDVSSYSEKHKEEVNYLTSYLSPALPFADECKVQFSDHQGVMVNCSSPLREVERMTCQADGCKNGRVIRHEKQETCGTCKGTGDMPLNSSPYGVLLRPRRELAAGEMSNNDIPVMRYIHPDTSILEFGNKSWRELLSDTQDALKLLFTDTAQSGIAKNIDREDKLAWLDKVAVNIYKNLIVNSIQIINKFQYPTEDYPMVTVNLPSTFVIKSEKEYADELQVLRNQNVPEFIIMETLREYTSKKFGGDPIRMKMFDVLSFIDPLFIKTNEEKVNLFNTGFVSEKIMQFSSYAPSVLSNFSRTNEINELSIEQIVNQIRPLIESQIELTQIMKPRG